MRRHDMATNRHQRADPVEILGRATRVLAGTLATVLLVATAATVRAHTPEEKAFYLQSRVVLQLNPGDLRARNAVGVWHLEYGELDAAEAAFSEVRRRNAANPVANLGQALVLEARGDATAALSHLNVWREQVQPPVPLRGFAMLVRARLLVRGGHLDAARTALDEAATHGANAHDLWFWRGRLREARGETQAAEMAYRRAIAAEPFWPEPYARLGALLQARGEADAAREVLQGVLNLDNPSPYPNNDVGILWRWIMRPDAR